MSLVRSDKRLAAALLCLSAVAALAGCGGSSPKPVKPVADLPPKQILADALAAARSAGSMHFDEQATDPGSGSASPVTVDLVGDALPTVGRQVITSGNAEMTELVLPGGTYVRGNAAALNGLLGLRAKAARRLANRWVVLHAGDPNYEQLTAGVTGDSLLSSITPVGSLTKAKLQKYEGRLVVGVVGKAPASSGLPAGAYAEFWVAATGKPLPVAAEELAPGGEKMDLAFTGSLWGEKVTDVAAPAGAVADPAG